jgi:AcrR family transcriptional regulator
VASRLDCGAVTVTGTFRSRVKGQLRDQLIDAALARAEGEVWERIRMADVAADVGVSRQTVYNEFGSKDGLAAAVLEREVGTILTGLVAELDRQPELRAAVEAAVLWVLRFTAEHPVLQRVLADTREGTGHAVVTLLMTSGDAALVPAQAALLAYGRESWPDRFDGEHGEAVVDLLVRHLVSHVVLPSGELDAVASEIARVVDRALPAKGD